MKSKTLNFVIAILVLIVSSIWAVSIYNRDALFAKIDHETEISNQEKVNDAINDNIESSDIISNNNNSNKLPVIDNSNKDDDENGEIEIDKIYKFSEFSEFQQQVLKVWNNYRNKQIVTTGEASVKNVGFGSLSISANIPYRITTLVNSSNYFSQVLQTSEVYNADIGQKIQSLTNWMYSTGNLVEVYQFFNKSTLSKTDFLNTYKQTPRDLIVDFSGEINKDFRIEGFYFDEYKNCYEFDYYPSDEILNKSLTYFISMFNNPWCDINNTKAKTPKVHFTVDKNCKVKNIVLSIEITNFEASYRGLTFKTDNGNVLLNQSIQYYNSYLAITHP